MSFSKKTFAFLRELKENNQRDWFEANKDRYEEEVREPARAFIRAVGGRLGEISLQLTASDKKSGGSLMRIHRDVRFSKDKSPYKTNVGIQFRHAAGKDVHAVGLYVHLAPGEIFLGSGTHMPPTPALTPIRAAIAEEGERWTAINAAIAETDWYAGGESLKRAPKGYPKDHPMVDELKRKSFILVRDLRVSAVTRKDFADMCVDQFAQTQDYLAFLCEALGIDF